MKNLTIHHWQSLLNFLIAVGVFILLLMFINFNSIVADNAAETKAISVNTNKTVKSQGDILDAIRKLAIDNKVTSDQKTDIIICMLQVPVEQRTTDTVTNCKKQVESGERQETPKTSQPTQVTKEPNDKSTQSDPQPNAVQLFIKGVKLTIDQAKDGIKSLLGR